MGGLGKMEFIEDYERQLKILFWSIYRSVYQVFLKGQQEAHNPALSRIVYPSKSPFLLHYASSTCPRAVSEK